MTSEELLNLDLEMKLINNRPIYAYVGHLYSPIINEITDIGLSIYNTYLTVICSTFDELKQYGLVKEDFLGNSAFQWLSEQCLFHTEYEPYILGGLSLFFKENISFSGYVFYIGEFSENRLINGEIFNYVQSILRKICCLESLQEDIENPANSKVKELLEKRKKYRQKLKKAKQNEDEEPLTLTDLISVYCADGNGSSILTVGEYSMYQFNDQFNRMTMLQDYNVNIQALLHGADNKEEMKSWMRKIKVED